MIKSFIKNKSIFTFYILKKINIFLINLRYCVVNFIITTISLFVKIRINTGIHPLIDLKKIINLNLHGFDHKITLIFKNLLIKKNRIYKINNFFKKNYHIKNNTKILTNNKNQFPISILESFVYKQKTIKFKKVNIKDLDIDKYVYFNFNSKKNLIIDYKLDFWHFYIQYIPIFIKIKKTKKFNLIIRINEAHYFFDLLNLFFSGKKSILKKDVFIHNTNFYPDEHFVYPYKKDVLLLRNELKKRLKISYNNSFNQKKYFIRRNAKNSQLKIYDRFLFNENKIFNYLKDKYKFEEYNPDGLDIIKQIKFLNSAKCIVSMHGSALSNIIAIHSNTCLIELNKDQDVRWHFAKMMNDMGLIRNYYLLVGHLYKKKYIKFDFLILKNTLDEILNKYLKSQ